MEIPALRNDLNQSYGLELPETATLEGLETVLAARLNTMIMDDFNGLVQLLYRIDVSEPKLKKILRENASTDAGVLIARLIVERQLQKMETRRKFGC